MFLVDNSAVSRYEIVMNKVEISPLLINYSVRFKIFNRTFVKVRLNFI